MDSHENRTTFELYGRSVISKILNHSNQRDSLVQYIAESIGYSIIEGKLTPKDDLNSVDLARQFHCSRTPIREALILLEKEGLIEIPPRRRPLVHEIDLKECQDIYEVRTNLYGLVAELIVANATDNQILNLEPYEAKMVESVKKDDLDAYFWANVAFQDFEIDICGNREVRKILDTLMLRMLKLRFMSLNRPGRIEQSLADHSRLLRAYLERDIALAVALKRGIVQRGLNAIKQNYSLFSQVPEL